MIHHPWRSSLATMASLATIALALTPFACARPSAPAKSPLEENLPEATQTKALEEKEFYPTGALAVERELKTDAAGQRVRHGVETTWYKTGTKRSVGHYEDGLASGSYTIWDIDGWKQSETSFEGGRRHGLFQRWYPDGKLQRSDEFKEGLPWGKSETWHGNGKKRSEGQYEAGQKSGKWIFWDSSERLLRTETWKAGEKVSESADDNLTHPAPAREQDGMRLALFL